MLEHYLIHGCTIYTRNVDEYNNLRSNLSHSTSCHFRDNDTLSETGAIDQDTSAAMAWFAPSEDITEGDIMVLDSNGQAYTISTIIEARKLGNTTIQFKKCLLNRFDSFVS